MQYQDVKHLNGEFVVIETDTEVWIGVAEVKRDSITVRSGYSGRPKMVAIDDVTEIGLAIEHPDVVPA